MSGTDSTTDCRGDDDDVDTSHLDDVDEGSGCAEVWEHLSEARDGGVENDGDGQPKRDGDGQPERDGDREVDGTGDEV